MESADCEAISFASGVEEATGRSKPSFLEEDGSSNEDEIFDRAVLALLALSTKRPYYSSSNDCDSLDAFQENAATDTLVTPSSRIGRAASRHFGGTIKSKAAPSKSKAKKARSAPAKTTQPSRSNSKKTGAPPSVKAKKGPTTSPKARSAPKTPSSASSSKSANESRWDSMVSKLTAYRNKHGDCRVPRVYEADQALANWVHNQRYSKSLTGERIDALNDLGFIWSAIDTPQMSVKKEAKTGKTAGAGTATAIRGASSPRPLGIRDGNRPPDRDRSSVKLSFSKVAAHSRVQVERKRKEAPVPSITPSTSRKAAKSGGGKPPPPTSSSSRARLEEAHKAGSNGGSRAMLYDGIWTNKFNALKAYVAVHGDTYVPASYPSNQPLSNWIRNQRSAFRRGDLLQDRIDRLDELCADWATPQAEEPSSAAGMGATKDGESRGPEAKHLGKGRVLSVLDLTTPETSEVIPATKVDYTNNAADANKQVIASIVWSPMSNTW